VADCELFRPELDAALGRSDRARGGRPATWRRCSGCWRSGRSARCRTTGPSASCATGSPNARFAAPEIKLGWIGGGGMTYLLAHSIGASNAARMILTGDPVDADRARAWGLVSEIHPLAELHGAADALARVIASRAPVAARMNKDNLRAAYALGREEAIRYERDLQTICFATEDAAEGRRAFKEKRPPVFRGR